MAINAQLRCLGVFALSRRFFIIFNSEFWVLDEKNIPEGFFGHSIYPNIIYRHSIDAQHIVTEIYIGVEKYGSRSHVCEKRREVEREREI